MAGENRGETASVRENLFRSPQEYSFFQAIRLLRLDQDSNPDQESFYRDKLRVHPQLSLGYPVSDLAGISEQRKGDGNVEYNLETSFLGLYGASSPLPTFYTKELMDEAAREESVTRRFLDTLNNDFYVLLFQVWSRNRLMLKVIEEDDNTWLERLNCLLGYGHEEIWSEISDSCRSFRHIGLFTQYPRSALGLKTLLMDALGLENVQILQCVERKVDIPADQLLYLGCQANELGEETRLGSEVDDCMGKCVVVIRDLDADSLQSLLPGKEKNTQVNDLIRIYLMDPLEFDIRLEIKANQASTAILGGDRWSGLAFDAWLFSGDYDEDLKATFPGSWEG